MKVTARHGIFGALILALVCALVVYLFRERLAQAHDRFRTRRRSRRYRALSGFHDDMENGLDSENFSISSNITNNDVRAGLAEEAKTEIKKLMNEQHLSFDDARLRYTTARFGSNDIDSSGLPRDPKLVTF